MSEEDFADKDIKLENADETEKALFKMTIKYRELLKGEHSDKVDFSCLQQRAYQYISQQLLSGTVFQHVIVDEYQDTNTIQKKIYMQPARGNKNCPRNYMVFHKYEFVPSRSQTMFFGSLVHQSIEDLQNFINGGIR